MKKVKSILIKSLIVLVTFICTFIYTSTIVKADNMPLVLSNGNGVYYTGTDIEVMIPDTYESQDTYFRGAWVTPLAGSIPEYRNKDDYKKEIIEMFDVLEYFNINALIFHVRIFNDALYPSVLNPVSSYLDADWDVLEWVIEECHNRGIEFHAWMNPYRVYSSGASSVDDVAEEIKTKCPANIGSDKNNLLMNDTGGVILNPGLPSVRTFIVNTVMEVIKNYNVDAIHFDDYFYISNINDTSTYEKYNTQNLSIAEFRREQVNLFIKELSETMRAYNKENNCYVQLGISPTGIYRNGDGIVTYDDKGNAISNGSKTNGQEHYEYYLYSDTLKWINEEWIDYITPQSYWAFSHPVAGYADVMSWWNAVVKYKKVNLYSGMGIFMSENPGVNYSWGFDPDESVNQILYASTLDNVKGTVFYNYNYLEYTYKGDVDSLYGKGLSKIKRDLFSTKAILPVITSMESQVEPVTDLTCENISNNTKISFSSVNNAKFYVIYKSNKNLTYSPDEVVDIINGTGKIEYVVKDTNNVNYNYAVRAMAPNNSLSEPTRCDLISFNVTFQDEQGNIISKQTVKYGENAIVPEVPKKEGTNIVGWSKDTQYVTKDLVVVPKYENSKFNVNFFNDDGTLIKTDSVDYLGTATPPIATKDGFVFDRWDIEYSNVSKDLDVYAIYKVKYCDVVITDIDNNVLLSYTIKYGKTGWFPEVPTIKGYTFKEWSNSLNPVTDSIRVKPIYTQNMIKVTFISDIDNSIIDIIEVPQYGSVTPPEPPKYDGYIFYSWFGNLNNLSYDTKVRATYDEVCYLVTFLDYYGNVIETVEYFMADEISFPEPLEIEGMEFIAWDNDLKHLSGDIIDVTVKPIYKSMYITITFMGLNDVIIDEKKISNSDSIVYPNPPTIEGYRFVSWDKDLHTSDIDTVIKAKYEKINYQVLFTNESGEKLTEIFVTFDEKITYPEMPEIEGYEFDHFDKTIEYTTENITIKAIYKEKLIKITYLGLNDKLIKEDSINIIKYKEIKDKLIYPEIPRETGYEFTNWDKDKLDSFTDQVIKAVYKQKEYTVSYVSINGEVIATEKVSHGNNATFPFSIPEIEDYEFTKYSSEGINITNDTTITLEYSKIEKGCKSLSIISYISNLSILAFALFIFKKH